jgi:hypothetical protein
MMRNPKQNEPSDSTHKADSKAEPNLLSAEEQRVFDEFFPGLPPEITFQILKELRPRFPHMGLEELVSCLAKVMFPSPKKNPGSD